LARRIDMQIKTAIQVLPSLAVIGLLLLVGACAPEQPATDAAATEAEAQPSEAPETQPAADLDMEVDSAALETVVAACQAEVETFCSQVTPGGGRLLACFAAHEDKLSGGCSQALYGFSSELEAFTRALAFAANACYEDITRFCADVEGGEGRVAECLIENQSEVSTGCLEAMGLSQ
jgi:hypothetical protein